MCTVSEWRRSRKPAAERATRAVGLDGEVVYMTIRFRHGRRAEYHQPFRAASMSVRVSSSPSAKSRLGSATSKAT